MRGFRVVLFNMIWLTGIVLSGINKTLDIIHDRFIRLFRVTLSNSLRKMANLSVNSTGPLKFSEFMNSLPLPSCLNILRLDPLRGAAVMVIESKLPMHWSIALVGTTFPIRR